MNTSTEDIQYLKTEIETKIKHSYLEKYIDKPIIDEGKMRLLIEMINHSSLPESRKQRYILTTMLVQMALDTHDKVPSLTSEEEEEDVKLQKQLHVLAGDYYSGLYYLVLAEINDFEFIRLLASAIKEINEYKMTLYYNEIDSLKHYMHVRNVIDTRLIVQIASFFSVPSLGEIAEKWLYITKLTNDMDQIKASEIKLNPWIESITNGDELIKQLTELLHQVENEISRLPAIYHSFSHYLLTELASVRKTYLFSMGEEG
ncbi:heptaprenyl diphosphate synthase component 1 [Virgibacillus pantothenticus]|uniref:heptaprenyl diphosphate synthase component 1 n=1 Tax=Virgibacillus pantothenticus TaxID=1473 RepID=UPI001C229783|nr:heptaprenyl diphosphate synthase component 1 [Virgibacillus pantothenticus]MBU8567887.1 heptaprenyl diphosphate synthase component 1 [Virgibacillus pantothenticus]MBU8601680.1 heptaprenyl diphosphate synthase component 1 [Virgibacillus pantothenticus]MBU8635853.1 heptaprenyl diphosphate synthase component 1 [Virgibacillus pantothenticus]MBU8641431.1 heptaprenyl diphosphate synthase component 1 [Virgibacillus pantothenticus]MBU8646116.1 heptaprenyl diphosphate synthase component 1 [Virgibaci